MSIYTPIILCGGIGSRLWPLSREKYPKQFISIIGKYSLLQKTILRVRNVTNEEICIICHKDSEEIAKKQMSEIEETNYVIILEPSGRNTAPAIALSSLYFPNKKLLVLSADQIILNENEFFQAIPKAINMTENSLVVFGVKPTYPETGYGYILPDGDKVVSFIEKPKLEMAKKLIENCLWNAGMFAFQSDFFLSELMKFSPEIYNSVSETFYSSQFEDKILRVDSSYLQCPSNSIDYAVLEKSKNVKVVETNMLWSDVGTWASLYDISEKDDNLNVIVGDVHSRDTFNSYIRSDGPLVVTIGVRDLVIVAEDDAILIMDKKSESLKSVVSELQRQR